jgi:hypothetical protein
MKLEHITNVPLLEHQCFNGGLTEPSKRVSSFQAHQRYKVTSRERPTLDMGNFFDGPDGWIDNKENSMAGSLNHVVDGYSLIENLGDAYEAFDEMLWLIHHCIGIEESLRLLDLEYYPMCRGEREKDESYKYIEERNNS